MVYLRHLLKLLAISRKKRGLTMPLYALSFGVEDELTGTTNKRYVGDFVDFAGAEAAAADLLTAYNAATTAGVNNVALAQLSVAGFSETVASAGSRVFERALLTTVKDNGDKHAMEIAAPVSGVFATGTNDVDVTAAVVTGFLGNFLNNKFTVSDGEHLASDTPLRGKRVFRSSGSSNLR